MKRNILAQFLPANSFENEADVKHINGYGGELIVEELPYVEWIFHLASQTRAYIARASLPRDVQTNMLETVQFIQRLPSKSRPLL